MRTCLSDYIIFFLHNFAMSYHKTCGIIMQKHACILCIHGTLYIIKHQRQCWPCQNNAWVSRQYICSLLVLVWTIWLGYSEHNKQQTGGRSPRRIGPQIFSRPSFGIAEFTDLSEADMIWLISAGQELDAKVVLKQKSHPEVAPVPVEISGWGSALYLM